jgi:short-subunit dehydrogenase
MYHTLITGASSGIGKAMAMECASRGMNLALVALDTPELEQTVAHIKSTCSVEVNFLGIDLTAQGAPERVYRWTKDLNLKVDTLINNAGIGNSGLFEHNEIDEYLKIIDLNNRSMVQLTYHFFNELIAIGKGHILYVSSMEATLPLPYKAVYTGTKSFIYAFSLAIREELQGTGVGVTVLCPGPVLTNEQGYKRMQAHQNKGRVLNKLMIAYPDFVARKAINGMLRGKRVVIPKTVPWGIVKLMKVVPTGLKMHLLERIFRVYE